MNFLFGLILIALVIMAIKVVYHTLRTMIGTAGKLLSFLAKTLAERPRRGTAAREVYMPISSQDRNWEAMARDVRREIQRRNATVSAEEERLDAQLKARMKTIELLKVNIQIAKLEQELQKVKPQAPVPAETSIKRRRRSKTQDQSGRETDEGKPLGTPPQIQALRDALRGATGDGAKAGQPARH